VIWLHVYSVSRNPMVRGLNRLTRDLWGAGGLFHVAVEVQELTGGQEWSFGQTTQGTGLGTHASTQNVRHHFRETLVLGETSMGQDEFDHIIEQLKLAWSGTSYHLTKRNCCTFANDFCALLKCGPIPPWTDRFSRMAANIDQRSMNRANKSSARRASLPNVHELQVMANCMQVTSLEAQPEAEAEVEAEEEIEVEYSESSRPSLKPQSVGGTTVVVPKVYDDDDAGCFMK